MQRHEIEVFHHTDDFILSIVAAGISENFAKWIIPTEILHRRFIQKHAIDISGKLF